MYWNFGGNFKPVVTACQYSEWTKCATTFIRYIWFEVVTDVADCLANEEVLWRVLAILLTLTTIAYFVYWKSQWKREVKRNQERFIAVNHKIQDLELKVDIITYKTQYGIWPLQYFQEKNTLANLKNFRFGLSKFSLENSWIKNILSRANEKKYLLKKYSDVQRNVVQKYSNIDEPNFPPFDCDNELLEEEQHHPISDEKHDSTYNYNSVCQSNANSNSEQPMQYLDASRINSLIVPPESNLSDRSKNRILHIKENVGARNNNSPRRKLIAVDSGVFGEKKFSSNQEMKIASTTNMTVYSKAFSEFQEKNPKVPSKNNQYLSRSHDTLLNVQERLETLYNTIHSYTTNYPLVPMLKLDSDSKDVHTSDEVSCVINDSTENTCASEDSKNIAQNDVEFSNSARAAAYEVNPSHATESANNGNHANCNGTEEACDQSSKFNPKDDKNDDDFEEQMGEIDMQQVTKLHPTSSPAKPTDPVNILEDKTEAFEIVEPFDDLTSALLQEALKFKKQILSKVEMQDNGIDIKEECTSNSTETNSETSLKQGNMTFESKILDMITEESSVSSCTERKGDSYDYKIIEKNKIAQDKTALSNEKNKRSCLKNTSSNVETLVDEKVKKQKDANCLSKVNNKSFNGESSSNRIFPSSFSTVFLCNDQDSSNLCKQTHDNDTTVETKSSQDLISLTGSSSDVSVNRLISKLIENERKLKKPIQLTESEKITMNGSTHNSKNSNDVKLTNPLIELTHSTVDCNGPIEDTNCNDTINEDTSEVECSKEITTVPKKPKNSALNIKENEEHSSLEMKTYSDSFSQCSSIPTTKFQNSEIKEIDEMFLKSNTNSSIGKHDNYSGNSANEKLNKTEPIGAKQDDALHKFKESDEALDLINFSNAQKLDCNNWKPSKAKSNSDLTAVEKRQLKLTHRRSKSYVNPRGLTDESQNNAKKEDSLESSTSSSQLSSVKVFDKKGNLKNVEDIKRNRSSESLCSTSSFIPIPKSISLKDGQIGPVVIDVSKKDCIKKESSLEFIPLKRCSSSRSCIPVMNSRMACKKNLEEHLLSSPKELQSENSLHNKTGDSIDQMDTDTDEICSLSISEEKDLSEKFTNFSGFDSFKNVAQNAIIYYNLVSEDQHVSNEMNQNDSSDMPIQEIIVTDNAICSKAASTIPTSRNGSITCVLSDELSELNSLNSIIFQNSISSISPYQIERKETEVLVKPSTLDISTSMTNFPCVYNFDEANTMNDLKIFEISDELTKEECIRYLQMIDEDANCDQSTNTHDFCNKLLQSG